MASIASILGASNATSRQSTQNPAGIATDSALFLKVFSGEILSAFATSNVMSGLVQTRTIQSGKSATFPTTGKATASYHTPGTDLFSESALSQIATSEKVINIDNMLISSTMIANIDELKNHFDVRSVFAAEIGNALAKRSDIQAIKTFIAAGLTTTANVTGGNTGTQIADAVTNTAAGIIDALFAAAAELDQKDVPESDRFAVLTPSQYYTLVTSDSRAVLSDVSSTGNDVGSGVINSVAGFRLFKSPHLAGVQVAVGSQDANDALVSNEPFASTALNGSDAGYNAGLEGLTTGTGSTLEHGFICGHPQATGCVKLLDLATESEYLIEKQSTLFVAKLAAGFGVLRPECAVVVNPTTAI